MPRLRGDRTDGRSGSARAEEDQAAAQPLGHADGAPQPRRPRRGAGRAARGHQGATRPGPWAVRPAAEERLSLRAHLATPHWATRQNASVTMALLIFIT